MITSDVNEEPAYRGPVPVDYRYDAVATLADEPVGLTCSVAVASKHFRGLARKVHGFPSFESAASEVRQGRADALLVPAAYPEIRRFFFDSALRATSSFLAELPDMVLVASKAHEDDRYARLYHHPATQQLLDELPFIYDEAVPVSSNTAAAASLIADDENCLAITNRLVADHHELKPLRVLAHGESMAFIVFERNEVDSR